MDAGNACWIGLAFSLAFLLIIYFDERRRYGGVALATAAAGGFWIYNLLNPLFYLIDPKLADKFTEYIGGELPASVLLPNILSTTIFLGALALRTKLVSRRPRRVWSSHAFAGLTGASIRRLVVVWVTLFTVGSLMYLGRNRAVYGSLFGSFSAQYAGATARPQVPFFSAYTNVWGWALQILLLLVLWQVTAKKWRWWVQIPPLVGGLMLAVTEGDRSILGVVVLIMAGWYMFVRRVDFKKIMAVAVAVTALTAIANARYNKETETLMERFASIVEVKYYRFFWSSDPSGPATVASLGSWKAQERDDFTWGVGYLENIAANIPVSLWANRPDDASVRFAKWWREDRWQQYASGTSFAYNAITESFVNFWYVGPFLFGLAFGSVCARVVCWCLSTEEPIGRAVFAVAFMHVIWFPPRSSLTVLVSLPLLMNYCLIYYVVWECRTSIRLSGRLRSRTKGIVHPSKRAVSATVFGQ